MADKVYVKIGTKTKKAIRLVLAAFSEEIDDRIELFLKLLVNDKVSKDTVDKIYALLESEVSDD